VESAALGEPSAELLLLPVTLLLLLLLFSGAVAAGAALSLASYIQTFEQH